MEYCILVINPGSTSTKIAVFQGEKVLLQQNIRHSGEELAPYTAIMDQAPFRLRCVEQALAGFDLTRLDAVCARGGMLPACPSGAFAVDQDMIGYLSAITQGAHASNLGCVMARDLAEPLHIPAYVYDPVAVDEMPPMARITGIPELPRRMMGHALNTRAMAIRCAETVLHKPFDQCRLIVLHLGGGASVRLFIGGKMVDNVRDDELLFAPERSGGIAAEQLVKLCYSGKYDRGQMMKLVRGKSGLLAHLGTSDAMEVERRIAAGEAENIYDYRELLESWGVDTEFKRGRMYVTDTDNNRYAFSVAKLDADLGTKGLEAAFTANVAKSIHAEGSAAVAEKRDIEQQKAMVTETKERYLAQIRSVYRKYRKEIRGMEGMEIVDIPKLKLPRPDSDIADDSEVKRLILACWRGADELRAEVSSTVMPKGKKSGGNAGSGGSQRAQQVPAQERPEPNKENGER